jgi:hypothetical protein
MTKRIALVVALSLAACSEEPPPPPPPKPTPAPVAQKPPEQAPASAPVAPPKPTVKAGPRVLKVTGTVLIDGAEAYEGMPVQETSVIETKAASTVVVTLFSGAVTQVRELARVEIGKNADWKKLKKKEWTLKLLAGAVWSFLPKGSSYEVATQNAVAGARGTIFYVQASTPDDSYVCDCDGEIEMTVGGKKKMLKSKLAHVAMLSKGAAKKAKPKPTKEQLGHTKAEIQPLVDLMSVAK